MGNTELLRLPTMMGLKTLIEVARRGFTTAAADSLNLSQSAVSKQLIALENLVGSPLFERTKHGMIPTEAGEIYLEKAGIAIKAMQEASLLVSRLNPYRKTLRVQVLPILGDRWLLPRFSRFTELHPDIDVQFTNLNYLEQSETPDAIFSFSTEPPSTNTSVYLFGREALLVATPSYWKKNGSPKELNELLSCTFLEHSGTPYLWSSFATSVGLDNILPDRIINYGYYTMVIRGALSGQGIAFIPKELIEEELETGQLTHHPSFTLSCNAAYWYTPAILTEGSGKDVEEILLSFQDWLFQSLKVT